MLVFLDDSGDPGFKIGKGSTRCFCIALVIFDDPLEAERCAVAIKEVRRALGYSDAAEFRFNKTSRDARLAFLARVAKYKFRIRAIIMDKTRIYSDELRHSKESFYRYAIKMVLQYSFGKIQNARLKIDGHGDREFRRELQTYLRRELYPRPGQPKILDHLRIVDSSNNVLIQLADMVAGALRRRAEGEKEDAGLYCQFIEKRIEDVWDFGRGM
ncbi:MAG: DUF3800 domain-containing protein [Nitrospira sp.]|nr:DUF3800 domain-containing protein [Nitrospira sp.]